MTIWQFWPSKYKRKRASCLWHTLLHEQRKTTRRGGDWSFANYALGCVRVFLICKTHLIKCHTVAKASVDDFANSVLNLNAMLKKYSLSRYAVQLSLINTNSWRNRISSNKTCRKSLHFASGKSLQLHNNDVTMHFFIHLTLKDVKNCFYNLHLLINMFWN